MHVPTGCQFVFIIFLQYSISELSSVIFFPGRTSSIIISESGFVFITFLDNLTLSSKLLISSLWLRKFGLIFGRSSGLDELIVTKDVNHRDLVVGDKNAVLIAARILGYGKEYSFTWAGEEQVVDLTELQNRKLYISE